MSQEQFIARSSLEETGHDTVPISNSLSHKISYLDDMWKQFLAQPLSVKKCHLFAGGAGYEYKGPESRDYKENFHVKLGYEIPKNATEVAARFIKAAQAIIRYCIPLVRLVAGSIAEQTSIDLWPMIAESQDQWVLRCLWYPPRPMDLAKNRVVAAEHLDKGLTIHLRESAKGFQIFWVGEWHDVSQAEGLALYYAGLLAQLYTYSRMKAARHRAVFDVETMETGRRAFVLFVDFGALKYDKKKFGSTQDAFENDANYRMSHEDFTKYFTEIALATD